MASSECWSCLSNRGERRISPGAPVHEGEHWVVEHAYPTRLPGWLVAVLRRHAEALHEVRPEEWRELGPLLERAARALRAVVACEKEYVACFAEVEHFEHIHFHVIPRAADLPAELLGTKSFALLKVAEEEAVPRETIRALCESLKREFAA